MNLPRKYHSTSKHKLLIPGGILLILLVYVAIAWTTQIWPFPAKAVTPDSDATRNITTYPSPKNNNPPSKQDTTASPTGSQTSNEVPVSPSLVATITQLEEVDNQVIFSADVQNTTSTGTCVVTFSNPNDRPVTQQSVATISGTKATCGPINISADEFSYLGSWQVSFHYYEGDQQATAQSNITIK